MTTDRSAAGRRHEPGAASGERWRRWLRWLLRFEAVVMGLAAVAVFLPVEWMAAANDHLGLAPFPRLPLVDYLTRSLSALYVVYGSLNWVTSSNVDRYAGVITYLAVAEIVFAVVVTGIDRHAGMPAYWTVSEPLMPLASGIAVLTLQRQIRRATPATAPPAPASPPR